MRRLASWSFHHRRIVVVCWLAAFAISFGFTSSVGTAYSNAFTLPDTESTQALQLLEAGAPKQSGDTEQIVIGTGGGAKVTDPQVSQPIQAMLRRVAKVLFLVFGSLFAVAMPLATALVALGTAIRRSGWSAT